ncbi:MAG: chemotaxis protein CheW [Spirochaetota bacterium]
MSRTYDEPGGTRVTNDEDDMDELLLADDDADGEADDKYLLFRLGDEDYGVPIDRVQSIEELQRIVAVPDMPPYVRGVINLRGSVIPVVDLRLRFEMAEREYDDRTCIIVIQHAGRTVGFIVDTVSEVQQIPGDAIQPPPEFRAVSDRERFIQGIGTLEGAVKILLAIERLMQTDEMTGVTDRLARDAGQIDLGGRAR